MGNESRAAGGGRPRVETDVLVWVAVGGVLGAVLRHLVDLTAPVQPGAFPWSTFGVNVSGAFGLGALHAYVPAHPRVPLRLRALLGAGLLGGFTTFSAYAEQTRALLVGGHSGLALAYVAGTVVAAVLAIELGRWLPARRGRR
jgi:CrcB protein